MNLRTGSPPHTRGKVRIWQPTLSYAGITPAHAGKRSGRSYRGVSTRDHPRTRGEKSGFPSHDTESTGSPPHTRGKVPFAIGQTIDIGITPAHAGKSECRLILDRLRQDHPRTRGEKSLPVFSSGLIVGSPPHTRGKAADLPFAIGQTRITPAHAGKRALLYFRILLRKDHPRTRGEK